MLSDYERNSVLRDTEEAIKVIEERYNNILQSLSCAVNVNNAGRLTKGDAASHKFTTQSGLPPDLIKDPRMQVSASCPHVPKKGNDKIGKCVRQYSSSMRDLTANKYDKDHKKPGTQKKLKRLIRKTSSSQLKLRVSQPHKLRPLAPSETAKRVFGFGSYLLVKERKETRKMLPMQRELCWRTALRLQRKKVDDSKAKDQEAVKCIRAPFGNLSAPNLALPRYLNPPARTLTSFQHLGQNPQHDLAVVTYNKGLPLPFVPCRSTSRSFNLRLSAQQMLALVRKGGMKVARDASVLFKQDLADQRSCRSLCPAMIRNSSSDGDDLTRWPSQVWGATCITARCICFPANQCPGSVLLRPYSDRHSCGPSDIPAQGCIEGLKKDWSVIKKSLNKTLHGAFRNENKRKAELELLAPQLQQREGWYNEILSILNEVKEAKAKLADFRQAKSPRSPTLDLSRVLRRIHSTL